MAPPPRRTILVIDDNDDQREALRRVLEVLGATVVVAANGLEGLTQLHRWKPDAVVCDINMPVMDGLEFGRRMRQFPQYEKVLLVAVTGRNTDADVRNILSAGYDAHVVKPIALEGIRAIALRLGLSSTEGSCAAN